VFGGIVIASHIFVAPHLIAIEVVAVAGMLAVFAGRRMTGRIFRSALVAVF